MGGMKGTFDMRYTAISTTGMQKRVNNIQGVFSVNNAEQYVGNFLRNNLSVVENHTELLTQLTRAAYLSGYKKALARVIDGDFDEEVVFKTTTRPQIR